MKPSKISPDRFIHAAREGDAHTVRRYLAQSDADVHFRGYLNQNGEALEFRQAS